VGLRRASRSWGQANRWSRSIGTRTRGKPDKWHGPTLLDVPFLDLPLVEGADQRRFLDAAAALLAEATGQRPAPPSPGRRTDEGLGPEEVRAALFALPNNFDYDGWVKVGLALYAALGSAGREDWLEWPRRWPGYDEDDTLRMWNRFASSPPREVTGATLFALARQHAWRAGPPQVSAALSALQPVVAARVAERARLDPVSYDRTRRAAAEALGVRATTLDDLVQTARPKPEAATGRMMTQPVVEPWPKPQTVRCCRKPWSPPSAGTLCFWNMLPSSLLRDLFTSMSPTSSGTLRA